jgi:LCP family protein required for cell wall assembly
LALGVGTIAGWMSTSSTVRHLGFKEILKPSNPKDVFTQNTLNVLVLGCDEDRTTGGAKITQSRARSDMMLLAHIDFDKKQIGAISIPRDTLVGFGKYHPRKINAYHAIGGPQLAQTAVETLLPGVHVDKVVTLNFEGFEDMVNAVGGVQLTVSKNMSWDDNAGHLHIHIKKGCQVLNGEDAMGFVRFRHSDDDFARNDRQHQFMLAFKDALKQKPSALPTVLDATMKMLSDGLDEKEVWSLGNFVNGIPRENIQFGELKVHDAGNYNLAVDEDTVQPMLRQYGFLSNDVARA